MRKLTIMLIGIFMASSVVFANGNPELREELDKKLILNLDGADQSLRESDYVMAKIKVVNGKIEVIEAQGSNEQLTAKVVEKLKRIKVKSACSSCEEFIYRVRVDKR